MGFVIFVIAAILILVIFFIANEKETPSYNPAPTTTQLNLSVPDPEVANPKDVIFFISNWDADIVRQAYHQLIRRGIIIPTSLAKIYQEKISKGYIFKEDHYWNMSIQDYQMKKENLNNYTETYSFELKGLQVASYKKNLRDCIIFEKVNLKKEPNNKYDKNAVKVVSASGMLGHVPADETNIVHPIIEKDHKAFIERIFDIDGFIDCTIIIYYN